MANMLNIYKRKVSLALKIETIAKLDAKAEADGSTRNGVAEYILASALSRIKLTDAAQAKIIAEVDRNRKTRRGR